MPRQKPMVHDWEEFAEDIYEKVGEALDYFCWHITGDTPLHCYIAHMDRDLYDLAEEFAGWSQFGITEKDIELLREMPFDISRKYSEKMQRAIEKVVRELRESL